MADDPRNLVIVMSDEHNRDWSGCYGHALAQTPHIDALAQRGTRFTDAYCNSPICVPSRAAFATGRYVHQTGHWDNAFPYDGTPFSWHHVVREAGHDCVSIGKLHFRGEGDHGFTEEILPLHVVDGIGDLKGALRDPLPDKSGTDALARDAGRGVSDYARYDFAIRDAAVDWIAKRRSGGPFVLFVSLVMPHFPLVAAESFYDRFAEIDLTTLTRGLDAPPVSHPVLQAMARSMNYNDFFDEERRAVALRAYLGMVAAVDAIVGDIVAAVDEAGLTPSTRIAYTSDHGDNLGNRGLWGKSVMYEDAAAIPLILSGPGIPAGHVCRTPVSLVDMYPTVLQTVGLPVGNGERPGRSLVPLANAPDEPERVAFAEYHAAGSITGMFMLRKGRHKLVVYPGYPPQLFDLAVDPGEREDLADREDHSETLRKLTAVLDNICDVEAVNARAFAAQAGLIAEHGGREAVLAGTDIPHTPAPV